MRVLTAIALAVGLAWPAAIEAQPEQSNALSLARAIERRAEATSFADLERFGEAASHARGREALRRLHHVAFILLNQSEFDRFQHWNGLLADKARGESDRRYVDIAAIDALKARNDNGESAVAPQITGYADTEPDWFARVHAITIEALLLGNERKAGAALKRLFQAEALIPSGDPDAPAAESDVWGTIGIELIQLNDLEGSAEAFQKADFNASDNGYPRPDFDDVYNRAYLATQLGDSSLDVSCAPHGRCIHLDSGLLRQCFERAKESIIVGCGIRVKHQCDPRQIGPNITEQIDPFADDFRLDE